MLVLSLDRRTEDIVEELRKYGTEPIEGKSSPAQQILHFPISRFSLLGLSLKLAQEICPLTSLE